MIIVTGGAGFIGSAIVSKLNSKGFDDILIVDSLNDSDKWKNLVNLKFIDFIHKTKFIELVENNSLLDEITAIIHMVAGSATTEKNADYLMENNYHYTRKLASYALEKNIRFIYASSAATYGDGSNGYSDNVEELHLLTPMNMYGYSKHLFDIWARKEKLFDKIVGLKFFNVYGPNEYHKGDMMSVVRKAYDQILSTGKIRLFKSYRPEYNDGEQERDFIYVKDCMEVVMWLIDNHQVNGLFNLGTGKCRTWLDLANSVFSAMGGEPKIEFIEMPESIRDRYQYHTEAKMEKLNKAGYTKPFYSLEEGIKDYVTKYLAASNPYL